MDEYTCWTVYIVQRDKHHCANMGQMVQLELAGRMKRCQQDYPRLLSVPTKE